jgi:hypothetical protein
MSQIGTSIDATYVANKLKEWSEKSNKPIEELKTQYQDILAKTGGKTDAIKYKKALNLMLKSFTTNMRSSAVAYQLIVLGITAPQDMVRNRRKKLEEKYAASPAECIADGSVRLVGDGYELIDINKTFPSGAENFNFGKPIPAHSWMTTLIAVAKKPGEDQKWMPATVYLRDELALEKIPLFAEMEVRLNGKYSGEQNRYLLNSAKSTTAFTSIVREVPVSEVTELVDSVYANKFVLPVKLHEDLEETKGDYNRFVVTEATLNRHYLNTKEGGMSSIELRDESLNFGETITGFLDPNVKSLLENLEDDSTVGVIARTSMMKEKDEDRNYTGNEVLGMNVYSVFERPE